MGKPFEYQFTRRVIIRMVVHRPDFIVIGAMKSATTTLHEQLARQPGFVMSRPKEPNFFSDDPMYARGWRWYSSLFASAGEADLCGESSTHYTKLPDYPHTVARMVRDLPRVKLIYVMRHPIERLMSHYVHELTTGRIKIDVHDAIERHHELIEYSRYAMQLGPFVDAYGFENILPVFFPRLVRHSQLELERIGRFLNHRGPLHWDTAMKPQNRGKGELAQSDPAGARAGPGSLHAPPAGRAAALVRVAQRALAGPDRAPLVATRPGCSPRDVFDADLAQLGSWLGIALDCESFDETATERSHDWCGS